jgi:2,3-bisphosphoglycerate-independent phosphoglycerate mutase
VIGANDGLVLFNFRPDRMRQLTAALVKPEFNCFGRQQIKPLHVVTFTQYEKGLPVAVAFPPESLDDLLGEVISREGLRQFRTAETEKYPHVTYFFNGGVEKAFKGEDRVIIPSPKDVATYDLKPEMSATEVTETVVSKLKDYDLVILNFANPDMVGHTGVVEAAVRACEKIDAGVKAVVEETLRLGGKLLITADHGNCEFMINRDGTPHTAHTTNLVRVFYVGNDRDKVAMRDGILADVAPTLLSLMGLESPEQMTGKSLVSPA